jgi:hypothetical protein
MIKNTTHPEDILLPPVSDADKYLAVLAAENEQLKEAAYT